MGKGGSKSKFQRGWSVKNARSLQPWRFKCCELAVRPLESGVESVLNRTTLNVFELFIKWGMFQAKRKQGGVGWKVIDDIWDLGHQITISSWTAALIRYVELA